MTTSRKAERICGVMVRPIDRYMGGVEILFDQGGIIAIDARPGITSPYILPGLIDSHVHIESSMLTPERFASMALRHGTVAVLADPHEVANVAGVEGIRFMQASAGRSGMKFFFGLPSCVPASPLERSGARIGAKEVEHHLQTERFYFLAEMMDYPGVLAGSPEVMGKIAEANRLGLPIDGHAPGLTGVSLRRYVEAGITTDHECTSLDEAQERISLGMKVLIREGSAARDFAALMPLIRSHPGSVMLCTDDCHPDYLLRGHINAMVERALAAGHCIFDVLRAASVNPIIHYRLPVGMLRVGDHADFMVVESLSQIRPVAVYVNGTNTLSPRAHRGPHPPPHPPPYEFRMRPDVGSLEVLAQGAALNVIQAKDAGLFTNWTVYPLAQPLGSPVVSEPSADLLKIVLLDRYSEAPPVVAFVQGFGFAHGAIASSIAHDSHHILAIGVEDSSLRSALEWIIAHRGGICYAHGQRVQGIALPYFGLMAHEAAEGVALAYAELECLARQAGSTLAAPFMTASFMALTVIPELKINHLGLFDTNAFRNIPLFVEDSQRG